MVNTFNYSTWKPESGGFLCVSGQPVVLGQPGIHTETPFQKKKKEEAFKLPTFLVVFHGEWYSETEI